MKNRQTYWFPAKRYGWGWGAPTSWQGWTATCGFLALIGAGALLLPNYLSTFAFVAYCAVVMAGFFLICWRKGEPTAWRWGEK